MTSFKARSAKIGISVDVATYVVFQIPTDERLGVYLSSTSRALIPSRAVSYRRHN